MPSTNDDDINIFIAYEFNRTIRMNWRAETKYVIKLQTKLHFASARCVYIFMDPFTGNLLFSI